MYIVMVNNRSEYSGPQIGVVTVATGERGYGKGVISFKAFSKLDAAQKYVAGGVNDTTETGTSSVVVIVSGPFDAIAVPGPSINADTSVLFWTRRDVCKAVQEIVADHVAGRLTRQFYQENES